MLLSGAQLYGLLGFHFAQGYHVISPDQGGHGESGEYVSSENEYRALKLWLVQNGCTKIEFLYGASMGAATAYKLCSDPDIEVKAAWLDGACLVSKAPFTEWLLKRIFRHCKRRADKRRIDALPILDKMYGRGLARAMTDSLRRIGTHSLDAICHCCCHYDLQPLSPKMQRRLHLDFGGKEFNLRFSRKAIRSYMPGVDVTIRRGRCHCEYMARQTEGYVKDIKGFLERCA